MRDRQSEEDHQLNNKVNLDELERKVVGCLRTREACRLKERLRHTIQNRGHNHHWSPTSKGYRQVDVKRSASLVR